MNTRLNNLGSIVGSFIVLMVFGIALAHDFAFLGYKLHPFLLAISAAAIAYGLIEALFAFVIAVAIYFAGLAQAGMGITQADPHVYILFSFVTCAVVLGMVQNSRVRQLSQARSELEEVRNESERLRQRLQVVNTANQKLNDRILGEVTTVQSFADVARRLSVLEEKDLYPALCELVGDFAHAQEASVYMLQGDYLVMRAQHGWEQVPQEARSLGRERDLLWGALDQRRVLTPLDLDKAQVPNGRDPGRRYQRLIAAPIFHPQTGEAMGVISIDKIPFAHLHGNTLGMLGVIAKWAGDSLYNATSFQDLAKQLINDELVQGCVPPILVQDRFEQEALRGQASALLMVQLQGLKSLDDADQVWFRKTFNALVQPLLSNGASVGRQSEDSYVLMFPGGRGAQEAGNQLVAEIRERFAQHPQGGRLSVFVGSATGNGRGSYEATRQQAMKSAQRC